MLSTYQYPEYAYVPPAALKAGGTEKRPAVVIGAGPVGLTAALDLAAHGVPVVVLDDNNTVSIGSRAVCYAKRALEVWDRLGCAGPMVDKGVRWKIGKVFRDEDLVYQFDLLPEPDHKMPAFINLQQYYLEETLVDRAQALGELVDLRWKNRVTALDSRDDGVTLTVETPDGPYTLEADWVIACDGAKSDVRGMIGARFDGQAFNDRFLIADVVMKADFPTERWFWFDPPFHRNQSVLLHKQADDVWRIDFQLGWDADPEEEKKPEKVLPRLKAMLGEDTDFELEWVSVYQFNCRRMDKFRHGRLFFAGDAAHQVSPFGARGANSGVQDTDNLAWKLGLVVAGKAPESLLDTYDDERVLAADDNLLNSTRSTDFITPKSAISRAFRDATLDLARDLPFARGLVNSGRLSLPTPYVGSRLNTPDRDAFQGRMAPGCPAADAPLTVDGRDSWLLDHLGGCFTLLYFSPDGTVPEALTAFEQDPVPVKVLAVGTPRIADAKGVVTQRYDGRPGTLYLIRPDQYVAARFRAFDPRLVRIALDTACGKG
ncbi:FAD-dependent oxidoreductase [Caenispirillum bisanense]|uniref:3-(3-hydroxy-phenyl)propionate hydroxylase n=1 Tax=Caenispirillum bisanense TaxID=414052 RepID=A0A286GRP3_9PROT|nr:FAD-dependent oxidoreductase [Caenispirillum bisanense]SOD98235.1 3-(3-hydroxy-phenyl)propionate hydroxylase [Caenispirillum bisanense]